MKPPASATVSTVGNADQPILAVTPSAPGLDPVAFAREAAAWIEAQLCEAGALVFRGFGIDTAPTLDAFSRAISPETPQFAEESSPRSQVLGAVYTSTDYPKEYPIQFHNEYSYANEWPMKIYFACAVPPAQQGATPIADARRILARLRPGTRARFVEKKVLYVRHFMPKMGVPWEKAFRTTDKQVVERYCDSVGIRYEWGAGGKLTTRQIGDAVVRHPKTGEEIWFNHAWFFNVQGLEPPKLREFFLTQKEDMLSTNTYYGDGTRIEDGVFDEIRAAYREQARSFPWQRGDVLLFDNMIMSHSREPFSGDRKILCVMAQPCRRVDVQVPTV